MELFGFYEDEMLNINGNFIILDDILEDISFYVNLSLFLMLKDLGMWVDLDNKLLEGSGY